MTVSADPYELAPLHGGGWTLRCRGSGETFHPSIGPIAEAETLHVQQQQLRERSLLRAAPLIIWDVGLGAAGNAVAVLDQMSGAHGESRGVRHQLHSFDRTLAPLLFALQHADKLVYLKPHLTAITTLQREGCVHFENISWFFHHGDFRVSLDASDLPAPDAILFDPYSPRSNPEMWSLDLFRRLRARLPTKRPALLTTYSRSTAVRVTLLLAGFFVGRGERVGAKDETTVASNTIESLSAPLDARWLGRVAASTASAPLDGTTTQAPSRISASDLFRVRAHPQFANCGD
jgi:tRNA U34 5-methylaminomethyl-2-thiouridine-forming methyltransferase MnmC